MNVSDSLQILILSGSVRRPSHTFALSRFVEGALSERGARVVLWDFREAPLPIADPAYHADPRRHPDPVVQRLAETADACDGFIWASPVYHNSYSGVLKNALDTLTIPHFSYKPVGLMGHGGDRTTQAVDHLRIVVRGLLGVALTTNVCTTAEDYQNAGEGEEEGEGEGYALASEPIKERVGHFADELVEFAHQFRGLRESRRRP
jgi:NAD(P)H-dependent FMN reductase